MHHTFRVDNNPYLCRVIVTLLAGLLNIGRTAYILIFLYSFLATAFFLVRPPLSLSLTKTVPHSFPSTASFPPLCRPSRRICNGFSSAHDPTIPSNYVPIHHRCQPDTVHGPSSPSMTQASHALVALRECARSRWNNHYIVGTSPGRQCMRTLLSALILFSGNMIISSSTLMLFQRVSS